LAFSFAKKLLNKIYEQKYTVRLLLRVFRKIQMLSLWLHRQNWNS